MSVEPSKEALALIEVWRKDQGFNPFQNPYVYGSHAEALALDIDTHVYLRASEIKAERDKALSEIVGCAARFGCPLCGQPGHSGPCYKRLQCPTCGKTENALCEDRWHVVGVRRNELSLLEILRMNLAGCLDMTIKPEAEMLPKWSLRKEDSLPRSI